MRWFWQSDSDVKSDALNALHDAERANADITKQAREMKPVLDRLSEIRLNNRVYDKVLQTIQGA